MSPRPATSLRGQFVFGVGTNTTCIGVLEWTFEFKNACNAIPASNVAPRCMPSITEYCVRLCETSTRR